MSGLFFITLSLCHIFIYLYLIYFQLYSFFVLSLCHFFCHFIWLDCHFVTIFVMLIISSTILFIKTFQNEEEI